MLLAVQLISSGDLGGGGAAKDKGSPVALGSATDYDPQGDGEEGGSTVELAVDGDPSGTAWETEHYDSDTFAGTKTGPNAGVGLYVTDQLAREADRDDRPQPRPPAGTPRSSPPPPARPSDLEEWGEPVGIAVDASSTEEIDLTRPRPAQYFLIWFNKASEARDQPGRYQVEVSDIELLQVAFRTRRSGRARGARSASSTRRSQRAG